jgi:hypothetical protein
MLALVAAVLDGQRTARELVAEIEAQARPRNSL